MRAPPSTSGSISKSSSHTPRTRRCASNRILNSTGGTSRSTAADTTKSLAVASLPVTYRKLYPPLGRCNAGRMTKRLMQRPDGSTWDDWGDDGELGRINLLTPAKVLEGVAEVQAGISFCLSLPLDFPGGTALNQRRYPPRLAPTEDMDGTQDTFYNVHM